jgi:hypothetical protein
MARWTSEPQAHFARTVPIVGEAVRHGSYREKSPNASDIRFGQGHVGIPLGWPEQGAFRAAQHALSIISHNVYYVKLWNYGYGSACTALTGALFRSAVRLQVLSALARGLEHGQHRIDTDGYRLAAC